MPPRTVDLARRAARPDEPEEGLAAVAALRHHLDALEAHHVERAFLSGLSWSRIAALLGVSRQAVHKKYAASLRSRLAAAAPDGQRGQRPTPTEAVLQGIRFARQEADGMKHPAVGPEHLLLGLLRDDSGPATETLEAVGISFAAARRQVRRLYGERGSKKEADTSPERGETSISMRARASLGLSLRIALDRGEGHVGVEHVLLALMRDPQGGAVRALSALGVTPGEVEQELDSRLRRVGTLRSRESATKERTMTEEPRPEQLTQEELDAEIGAALPERELMSILPMPDATGSEIAAIVDDCEPDAEEVKNLPPPT